MTVIFYAVLESLSAVVLAITAKEVNIVIQPMLATLLNIELTSRVASFSSNNSNAVEDGCNRTGRFW